MKARLPEIVLALVTVMWGGTFLVTRTALEGTGPFTLLFLRFAVGALVLGAFVRGKGSWHGVFPIVLATAVAYASQTVALRSVESARAAFITALYVPLVPLLQGRLTGVRPTQGACLGAGFAFAGLAALSYDGRTGFAFGVGEALLVVGALASALQIVLVGRFAAGAGDPLRLTAAQLGGVALLMSTGAAAEPHHLSLTALALALGLGVFATAGALVAMNWAQRSVPPARATLLYALEPVWAALFGMLAGERLGVSAGVGGALVVAGLLVSEFVPERRRAVA